MENEMRSKEYQDKQLEEIRLGEESGVDTSFYARPEFSWLQMEQIRLGLEEGIDVGKYAKEEYSSETMKQIRIACFSHVDLAPYIEQGFTDKELEEIRISLEKGLAIEQWLDLDMFSQQIYEIRLGLEKGLNVGVYADISYNWLQMKEIRKGLEEGLDVTTYAKSLMGYKQMQEIRFGLEAGLDVTDYCDLINTTKDMQQKRLALLAQQGATSDSEKQSNSSKSQKKDINEQLIKSDISVMTEENGLKAYVSIHKRKGIKITETELLKAIRIKGILYGILEEQIETIVKKQIFDRNILVAEGIPSEPGTDGWYEFMVRTGGLAVPEVLPDGSVDYTSVQAIESVEVGQTLAVYHSATKGKHGKDIFGRTLLATEGVEKKTLRGSGFSREPDMVTYIANKSGKFDLIEDRIVISDIVVIHEDVTTVSGRVEIDGSVHVLGSVCSGAFVQATRDIVVEGNVEAGTLIAGGSIMVKRGCCAVGDCLLKADGEVSGKFFEGIEIKSIGDIRANYIMNSQISTMGKVIISGNRGAIMGGKTHAMKGVDTHNLGNNTNLLTVIDVGKNETYQEKLFELKRQKEKCAGEMQIYLEGKRKFSNETIEISPEQEKMLSKIETAIKMKQRDLDKIEEEIRKLANIVERSGMTPITVWGIAYAGALIMIDGSKYLLNTDVRRVSFRRREKKVVVNEVVKD